MNFTILGSGAVGGYYGAKLARAGNRVTFIARGPHLKALRERGMLVWSVLGDFTVKAAAEEDPATVGPADVVIVSVKNYDNGTALPMLRPLVGPETVVLTLQNGVDSIEQVAAVVGKAATIGGATYVATALTAPGLIEQIGTHRRIVFGEVFGDTSIVSERVRRISERLAAADIMSEPVPDARVPIWEKFIFLAPFAAFTGASRLPIGPLWAHEHVRETFVRAAGEVEGIARAEGVAVDPEMPTRVRQYVSALEPETRASLLIDLAAGKRIEVEALHGSIVRRGRLAGVATPIMDAFYAVLKPHESGSR